MKSYTESELQNLNAGEFHTLQSAIQRGKMTATWSRNSEGDRIVVVDWADPALTRSLYENKLREVPMTDNYPLDMEFGSPPKTHVDDFLHRAKNLVADNWNAETVSGGHRVTELATEDDFYIVWFCKTLGNWKALVSTDLVGGRYYEVTHDGAKKQTYVDLYFKATNTVVPDYL